MSFCRPLKTGLRVLTNRTAADQDLADEVQQYLDEATHALVAQGLDPEEARRTARMEIGNATLIREEVRSYVWENVIGTLLADLRYGARQLRGKSGFTAVKVLTTFVTAVLADPAYNVRGKYLGKPIVQLPIKWEVNMTYVKSALAGIVALLLSVLIIPFVALLVPTVRYRPIGDAWIGFNPFASLVQWPVAWFLAPLIFGAGFYWEFQRSRHSH